MSTLKNLFQYQKDYLVIVLKNKIESEEEKRSSAIIGLDLNGMNKADKNIEICKEIIKVLRED